MGIAIWFILEHEKVLKLSYSAAWALETYLVPLSAAHEELISGFRISNLHGRPASATQLTVRKLCRMHMVTWILILGDYIHLIIPLRCQVSQWKLGPLEFRNLLQLIRT